MTGIIYTLYVSYFLVEPNISYFPVAYFLFTISVLLSIVPNIYADFSINLYFWVCIFSCTFSFRFKCCQIGYTMCSVQ